MRSFVYNSDKSAKGICYKHFSFTYIHYGVFVLVPFSYTCQFWICFVKKDRLIADQAQKAWSGMDIALPTAMSELKQSSSGPLPTSLGLRSGSEIVVRTVS